MVLFFVVIVVLMATLQAQEDLSASSASAVPEASAPAIDAQEAAGAKTEDAGVLDQVEIDAAAAKLQELKDKSANREVPKPQVPPPPTRSAAQLEREKIRQTRRERELKKLEDLMAMKENQREGQNTKPKVRDDED